MAKSPNTGLIAAVVILTIILILGITLDVIFYLEYKNITTKESPLCLTGSCKASSQNCGGFPFKVQDDGTIVCKPSIFNDTTPNVSITPT